MWLINLLHTSFFMSSSLFETRDDPTFCAAAHSQQLPRRVSPRRGPLGPPVHCIYRLFAPRVTHVRYMSSAAGGALVTLFLIDLVVLQITHAISVNMLDMGRGFNYFEMAKNKGISEFMKPFQDSMVGDEEWNAFGIRRVKRGDILIPSTPRPEKIEFPSRNLEIPISPFITRGLKSIGKVFVYNSTVEKKVEVQVPFFDFCR